MNFRAPIRIWAILLAAVFLFTFSVGGQESPTPPKSNPPAKVKKKSIKSSQAGSSKKKKKTAKTKKRNKARPAVKKPKAEAGLPLVSTVRPPANGDGPIHEAVEQEIRYLRSNRRLQPGDEISIQIYDLADNKMLVDINGDQIRNAASVIKPYVMLAVYEQIARQELNETPDITRQVRRMITISDNHATNTLIRHLGQGDYQQGFVIINALVRKYGFQQTVVRELIPDGGKTYANRTSAADATLFFKLLYEQKLVNSHYSQKMTDVLLKNVHHRIKTQQIKQDGVAVADKTGYVRGLNADCGIVYQKNQQGKGHDYVLSIFIENKERPPDGSWGRRKSAVIRYLSDRIYLNLKTCTAKVFNPALKNNS
jgi:beta-lactamase class A